MPSTARSARSAADFQIIRPNELIELEAKYAFETDDGAVVYVENKAIRLTGRTAAAFEAWRAGRSQAVYFRHGAEV